MARTPEELEMTVASRLKAKNLLNLKVADVIAVINEHPDGDGIVQRILEKSPKLMEDLANRLQDKADARGQAKAFLAKTKFTREDLDLIL